MIMEETCIPVLTCCEGFPQGAAGEQDGVGTDDMSPKPSGRLSVKVKLKAAAQPASSQGESFETSRTIPPCFCLSGTRSMSRCRHWERCKGSKRV